MTSLFKRFRNRLDNVFTWGEEGLKVKFLPSFGGGMSVRQENRFKAQSIARFRQAGTLAGELEALRRGKRRQDQQTALPGSASRRQVRNWMCQNAGDYDGATALAEAANIALSLPPDAMGDPDHWIWDEALLAIPQDCAGG